LGLPGCANCKNLEKATRQAIADLSLGATIEKVTDYPTIAGYGVTSHPSPRHRRGCRRRRPSPDLGPDPPAADVRRSVI
jgi:hypothetical protein